MPDFFPMLSVIKIRYEKTDSAQMINKNIIDLHLVITNIVFCNRDISKY